MLITKREVTIYDVNGIEFRDLEKAKAHARVNALDKIFYEALGVSLTSDVLCYLSENITEFVEVLDAASHFKE